MCLCVCLCALHGHLLLQLAHGQLHSHPRAPSHTPVYWLHPDVSLQAIFDDLVVFNAVRIERLGNHCLGKVNEASLNVLHCQVRALPGAAGAPVSRKPRRRRLWSAACPAAPVLPFCTPMRGGACTCR